MKEQVKKIAAIFADITKAAKDGDNDALIAKLEEGTTALEEAQTEAETVDADIAKTKDGGDEEAEKAVLEKYADLYVSAEDFKKLMQEVKDVSDKFSGFSTSLQSTLEKAMDEKIEDLKKTTLGSRQDDPDQKIDKSSNPLQSLANRM